ncbi:hypothetical protein [Zooshikella harenae]|uniref:Periplasmic sensor domain-containing protein n=1 Tax=Zooshikella harenae TaxID=2827238 RepID=A0ABS5ZG76_9GAMM|nr:hypothetical protein [Zooshikella harenae]MBU2713049.1 hypothetical protein [Zooshikella harenae]
MGKLKFYSPIGRKLLVVVISVSTMIAVGTTAIQLSYDYFEDIQRVNKIFVQIEKSSLPNLNRSLWSFDEKQIDTQLKSLLQIPEVVFVKLTQSSDETQTIGQLPESSHFLTEQTFQLTITPWNSEQVELGQLTVVADLSETYRRLWEKLIVIFISNCTKTAIVAFVLLIVFWQLVTKHIITIARYINEQENASIIEPLSLSRNSTKAYDELDCLVDAVNNLYQLAAENKTQTLPFNDSALASQLQSLDIPFNNALINNIDTESTSTEKKPISATTSVESSFKTIEQQLDILSYYKMHLSSHFQQSKKEIDHLLRRIQHIKKTLE